MIPASGTATYTVATVDDTGAGADEPNGKVTVTVNADPARYILGESASASVDVHDNDATPVTLVRSGGSGAIAEDGGTATVTLALGRALVAGEIVTAPLTVTGAGIEASDYTLARSNVSNFNIGVSLDASAPHSAATPTVVFTGHDTDTVQIATLTLTAVDDTVNEGGRETLDGRLW